MVDKSWGASPAPDFRIRTNAGPDQRAADRAAAREARATERVTATERRLEERAAARDAEAQARERARTERREAEEQRASGDPHAAAAQRRRESGRKDVVREQRDTRGYATVVDAGRIRTLAARGASITGLAGAFGIGEAEIAAILADTD